MSNEVPEFMNPSLAMEAQSADAAGRDAVEKLRAQAREGKVTREVDPDAPRMFISPTHPNGKFLITAGETVFAPYQSTVLGMRPAIERVGDLFARFNSGIITTKDPLVLDWLYAHSGDPVAHRDYHAGKAEDPRACSVPIGLCHEQGPGVDVWAEMKEKQVPTSRRPAVLSPDIDVDAFLRGDHLAGNSIKTGTGKSMTDAATASANAAAERADGQRNR